MGVVSDKRLKVIVDADAIVAQAHPLDSSFHKASTTSRRLSELGVQVLYPSTAILEGTTALQTKLSSSAIAYDIAQVFTTLRDQIVPVDQTILQKAVHYFSPSTSKKNTLFDCVIAAVADEYKADAIFSFDKFYKKKGFKLASEL